LYVQKVKLYGYYTQKQQTNLNLVEENNKNNKQKNTDKTYANVNVDCNENHTKQHTKPSCLNC